MFVQVGHLNHHSGVLGKQVFHHVLTAHIVQVHMNTALLVGKRHLQQRGYQTTGTDIMTCHHPPFVDECLYCLETVGKVFRVFHCWNVAAHLA